LDGLLPLAEPSLVVVEAGELDAVSLEPLASVADLLSELDLVDEDEPSAAPSPPEDLRA
jgi:hypothetical protein